jgi:anion-transporting  ArsA/GET3 family ATPase
VTAAVVVTGGGGVGKTTMSAALATAGAATGMQTLVVTVDPARRLAAALGVAALGNRPTEVVTVPGLWAAMLDVTASWEAIVHRHAEPGVGARLLANPFFRAIADRFPAAQAYAAGEQLAEHIESRLWDLVVVDTPPAGGGIDFYTAPGRMRDVIGGRLLRWLTGANLPGRRALYKVTARPALKLADAVLGGPLLEEMAEFLLDLRTLHDGISRRSRAIEHHFAAAGSLVVTTTQPSPMRETLRFFEELPGSLGPPDFVVFNKQLPETWNGATPLRGADVTGEQRTVLRDNLVRWAEEAHRQRDVRQEFITRYGSTPVIVPWREETPTSVAELATLIPDVATVLAHLTTTAG